MKSTILYAYPPEPDGLSMQGDMLYRGMKENGEEVLPCHFSSDFQKEALYQYFKPDVAIGVGYWGHSPELIFHTEHHNIQPVPWFVADGWVANYHKELSALPLVLTTSEWVKKTYERDGVDTKNFEVAQIGLEPDIFKPIPKSDLRIKTVRKMLGVKDDEIMILTVGGDATSKGAQEILQALKIVDKDFKKWKYVMKAWDEDSVGGHYENEMRLIEELGSSKNKVEYLFGGFSWDFMPLLINACDIYAAPSRLEGYGMIQVEAQSSGIPVISINEMGPKETIVHGKTGFLARVGETVELTEERAYTHMGFDADRTIVFDKPKIFEYRADPKELAEYILKLATDEDLRKTMGEAGRKHAVENFEYHKTAKRITSLVKKRLNLS